MDNMVNEVAEIVEQAEVLVPEVVTDAVAKNPSMMAELAKCVAKKAPWVLLGMGAYAAGRKVVPMAVKAVKKMFKKPPKYIESTVKDTEVEDVSNMEIDDPEEEYPIE